MYFIHKISGILLNWVMNNKYVLLTLNILLPVAVYFEAGPVSAFVTYFGFFLVVSMAMSQAKEENEKDMMGAAIKEMLGSKAETTNFETDEYSGSITKMKIDDLPDEIKEMIDKQENNEDEPTKH